MSTAADVDQIDTLLVTFAVLSGDVERREVFAKKLYTQGIKKTDLGHLENHFAAIEKRNGIGECAGLVYNILSAKQNWRDAVKTERAKAKRRQDSRAKQGDQSAEVSTANWIRQPDGELLEPKKHQHGMASRLCYHTIDVGLSFTDAAAREPIDGTEARLLIRDYAKEVDGGAPDDERQNLGGRYVRMDDRPEFLQFAEWKAGKRPIEWEAEAVAREQRDLVNLLKANWVK